MQTTEEKIPDFELVQEWLNQEPEQATNLKANTAATVAYSNVGALFLGKDESDSDSKGKEIFSDPKNMPIAIASILNFLQDKSNFRPSSENPKQIYNVFNDFLYQLTKAPILNLISHQIVTKSFKERNYDLMLNDVTTLYRDVTETDKSKIKDNLKSIAGSLIHTDNTNYTNFFSQIAIKIDDYKRVLIILNHTTLNMSKGTRNPEMILNQNYNVVSITYEVSAALIQRYSEIFAERFQKTLMTEWVKNNNTPQNPSLQLCF